MLLEKMYGKILLRMSLSEIFAKKGKRLRENIRCFFLVLEIQLLLKISKVVKSKLILGRHLSEPLAGQLLFLGGIWKLIGNSY